MKMLFSTIIVMLALGITSVSAQQQGTSNIKFGYGLGSTNSLLDLTSNLVTTSLTLGTVKYDNLSGFGTLYVGYEYAVVDKLMLGAAVAYESNKEDMSVGTTSIGEVSHNHLTFGVDINYHYISSQMFQMYSGIGAAYTKQTDKYDGDQSSIEDGNSSNFNFQINALGFRYGSSFGVFAELGFGYKGIITAGISYQF